jgi:hypothetical protein
MRKHAKRIPRAVVASPIAHLFASNSTVASHAGASNLLHLRNHMAMVALSQGVATTAQMDDLIAMSNVTEALCNTLAGISTNLEPRAMMLEGKHALVEVCRRGAKAERFVLKAREMTAINALLDLHDRFFRIITVRELETANAFIARRMTSGALLNLRGGDA